jgi:hypothetical protein
MNEKRTEITPELAKQLASLDAMSDEEIDLSDIPEQTFGQGSIGKYASRYAEGTNVVLIDPELAQAFPDTAAVNAALRSLLRKSA